MRPIVSICIPTFNRANYLKKTLQSIVCQDKFIYSDEVEIVISDNCSYDNTFDIAQDFIKKYGDKIKYFKTEKNSGFNNFEIVLSKGSGLYLKLNNDTLTHKKQSLEFIVGTIKKYSKSKPSLFFRNIKKDNLYEECLTADKFISEVSYFNTWIGAFGIWKDDLLSRNDWFRCNSSSIPQTDILFRQIYLKKSIIVIYDELFYSLNVENKGGYNIAEVFGYNYLNILKKFVKVGQITKKIYFKEKKDVLIKHINYFYFDLNEEYNFEKTGYFKWLLHDYKYNLYFWISFFKILYRLVIKNI